MVLQVKPNQVFDSLQPSSTLFINEQVNKLWQQGEQVFHMGFGESRFAVHPILQNALQTNADKKSYLPARGLPELTDAVANYYSQKLEQQFNPSQVIIGPGSKLLIYGLQMVLNADVFLPAPSWVSYAPQATLLNNRFTYIPSGAEKGYLLELEVLDKAIQSSTSTNKLLIINSPNNPTGQMLSDRYLQDLATYCRANNVLVLSDEIYFQVTHGSQPHTSISKYYPEGTLVLGGLSKHLSLGGWRLGVGLLPDTDLGKSVMKRMVVFASETWSGVSAPIQYAAVSAYKLIPEIEQYVADCASIHGIRTRYIKRALSALGVRCSDAEGAFYFTANFDAYRAPLNQRGVSNSSGLAAYLLHHYHIASLPGSDFGLIDSELTLRLSTSYLDMETNEGADRLYQTYKSGISEEQFMSKQHHPQTVAACQTFASFVADLIE